MFLVSMFQCLSKDQCFLNFSCNTYHFFFCFLSTQYIKIIHFTFFIQAFVQTASKIYENIQSGVCDVSNEAHGIKVGVSASNGGARYLAGDNAGKNKDGGCC